ncbi:LysM peptidoglycan-binding domain-containing protein [Fictibacillus iocasae]|uniref:LysM peptidoglycan-binding domain-containing protein n=1 Tax=Fictibacillus iocasae TaxID=2715437 RepID=A0ABW2NKF8_9BACL
MKPFFIILSIFCLAFSGLSAESAQAANHTLTIGNVLTEKVNVYLEPRLSSSVITVMTKGEEYPIVSKISGDSVSPIVHTVKAGETLWLIAKQFDVLVADIQRDNRLVSTRLAIGQRLKIPQKNYIHAVVKYDTLWKLAGRYGVSVTDLMKLNSLKSTSLTIGQKLKVPDYYAQLQLLGGRKGYVKLSKLKSANVQRFNLAWKYNGSPQSYLDQLSKPGLDIVSPRWYTLSSDAPFVNINTNADYAAAAAKAGKKVWPLFGNKFDPALTDLVMSDAGKRQQLISALVSSLVSAKAHGINVDFENVDPKNKQHYVTFITELKRAAAPHGMIVSVDVSRENDDPFWSGSLDRAGLGKAADFIIMMGYDEHWGGSPKAGSVASLPWTIEGIELLLKDVPAQKVVLGVPFYTREWVTDYNGKVRSIDRTMIETEKLIAQKGLIKQWDSSVSQHYVEFTENGEKHQIWVEDRTSMKLRYDIVKKYHLRGTAAWYAGAETADVWDVLK